MIFFAGRESGPLQVRLMLDNQRVTRRGIVR